MKRDPLLASREKTHGSFLENAAVSQALKAVLREHGYLSLHVAQVEALDVMMLKIARALQHPELEDHWRDIAGYANLAREVVE